MNYILQGLGLFAYPLGLCSVLAVAVFFERLWALRRSAVVSAEIEAGLRSGQVAAAEEDESSAGRVLRHLLRDKPDYSALKARAELEMLGLERGFFIIETIVSLAPMLGLLGTVWGLVDAFRQVMISGGGAPEISRFAPGIAVAFTTTIGGLIVAMVSLVGVGILNRRLDLAQTRLNLAVERAWELVRKSQSN